MDISIYGVNPEGGAAFLGEGRYEGRYSESNEYCDKPITLVTPKIFSIVLETITTKSRISRFVLSIVG